MRDLVIVGAGGFGRETIDVVRAINAVTPTWNLAGVVDDSPSAVNLDRLARLGISYLGEVNSIALGDFVAVAVGNPDARRRVVESLFERSVQFPKLVHPSAVVGSEFRCGEGLIILGGVSIGTNVSLGEHVHLNGHAVLGHDTICHDYVSVNPQATLSGEVTASQHCLVGAGATVLQGLTLGAGCLVGAGAVVVRSVAEGKTVTGVPAT